MGELLSTETGDGRYPGSAPKDHGSPGQRYLARLVIRRMRLRTVLNGVAVLTGSAPGRCARTMKTRAAVQAGGRAHGWPRAGTSTRAPVLQSFTLLLRSALAFGCSGTKTATPGPPSAAGSQRAEPSHRSDVCGNDDKIRSRISGFVSAFNDGSLHLAERFFDPPPRFQWYSEPPDRLEGQKFSPYDYTGLDAYLASKHLQGERLELVSVGYSYIGGREADVSFLP